MPDRIRTATTGDHPALVAAVREWWGESRSPEEARQLSLLLPRLFLQHFAGTSLVMESDGETSAFLIGFHSPDRPREAYIHFVGVGPEHRRHGMARRLYERFFEMAGQAGRDRVRAITSPRNQGSIAFHRAMGFQVERDGSNREPTVFEDYDGPGQHRVCFVRHL